MISQMCGPSVIVQFCAVTVVGPHGIQTGIVFTYGGGGGLFTGHFVSGSKSLLFSPTATTLSDRGGVFHYVSGGVGAPLGPWGVGGDASYAWGSNSCGQPQSVYTFGPSVNYPPGASVTGGVSNTIIDSSTPDFLLGLLSQVFS